MKWSYFCMVFIVIRQGNKKQTNFTIAQRSLYVILTNFRYSKYFWQTKKHWQSQRKRHTHTYIYIRKRRKHNFSKFSQQNIFHFMYVCVRVSLSVSGYMDEFFLIVVTCDSANIFTYDSGWRKNVLSTEFCAFFSFSKFNIKFSPKFTKKESIESNSHR